MNNMNIAMIGESFIANKLDQINIRYWWGPAQRNFYGADFLTEYGVIDVKIGKPRIYQYVSVRTGNLVSRRFWRFN